MNSSIRAIVIFYKFTEQTTKKINEEIHFRKQPSERIKE